VKNRILVQKPVKTVESNNIILLTYPVIENKWWD